VDLLSSSLFLATMEIEGEGGGLLFEDLIDVEVRLMLSSGAHPR
jgi:hypothetical protein